MTTLRFFAFTAALLIILPAPGSASYLEGLNAYKGGNYAAAYLEWEPLARKGSRGAQYGLGLLYSKGRGVEKDQEAAVNWFRKAANQGLSRAQFSLALRYRSGNGIARDDTEAVNWFRKAADQGYARSQVNLAWHYLHGRGTPRDLTLAREWYQKAAWQGNAKAQHKLGDLYRKGIGVPVDLVQARIWYQKAAGQGHAGAKSILVSGELEGRRPDTKRRAEDDELTLTDVALFIVFITSVLGIFLVYIFLQFYPLVKWTGMWRLAAALPLIVIAAYIGEIILHVRRDPTAHNLWPFEILMVSIAGLVFLGLCALMRWVVSRQTTGT